MTKRTVDYLNAQDKVKIGHFTRQGFDVDKVIHVGANGGLEIKYYLELGAEYVLGFEPHLGGFIALTEMFRGDRRVELFNVALSDVNMIGTMLDVTEGDGFGSSFLQELRSPYRKIGRQPCAMMRGEDIMGVREFDTLVVDVQGMELSVLRGFGDSLRTFKFLNIECSEDAQYLGGVDASTVVQYLDSMGFQQDSPIVSHDDVMFIRKGLK